MKGPAGPKPTKSGPGSHRITGRGSTGKLCRFCGRQHEMTRDKCPAYGQQCLKCQGWNHFAVKCTKKTSGINRVASDAASVQYSDTDRDLDGTMGAVMGEVTAVTPLHKARMRIQGKDIKFLLDSGASVSLLSTHHVDVSKVNLSKKGKTLRMWNGSTQTSMGTACMNVFNPKTSQSQSVDF